MQVFQMMRTDLVTVPPETPFKELLRMQACQPARQIYVVNPAGEMIGLITSYDLLRLMSPEYLDSGLARALPDDVSVIRRAYAANEKKTAAEVMNIHLTLLKTNDHFLEAELLIRESKVNVLPVADENGKLVGEVTRKLVLRYIALDVLALGGECKEDDGCSG